MIQDRRSFLRLTSYVLTSGFAFVGAHSRCHGGELAPLPNPATFESGDFLWPKNPHAWVPYHAGALGNAGEDETRWRKERDEFLRSVDTQRTHLTDEDLRRIANLDYQAFYEIYAGDRYSGQFVPFSTGGPLYVGHVGIIELDDEENPWVIEALYERGVVRHPYSQWIASRPGQLVWHGRLKSISKEQRRRIALEGKAHTNTPYNFWNFDLNDESDFYCSKLAWLSVFRSLGFAVDGNSNPKRKTWFSPKQLLDADSIVRLHSPAEYS